MPMHMHITFFAYVVKITSSFYCPFKTNKQTERDVWALTNRDKIQSAAQSPLSDTWWTEAEDPFQFLAVCIELNDLFQKPESEWYVLHV